MNLEEYYELRYVEYPSSVTVGLYPLLPDIVNLEEANLELLRHLAGVILCRCFPFTGGINFDEPRWLLTHFLTLYKQDVVRPWLTDTIKRAIERILSENVFTDNLIGTTFMFGILEFYAKQKLSGRSLPVHSFEETKDEDKFLSLEFALKELQKKELLLSLALCKIDNDMNSILKRWEIQENEWTKYSLAARVSKARNDMLHGNKHMYYTMGEYMAMLYALFHLYDLE